MTALPDPSRSRAVVIGVDSYSVLPALPSVANNVNDLASLLSDSDLWGLRRPDHCKVLLNPQSPATVLDAVHDAATEAEDAFLVYFAGHGLVSPSGELFLALPQSHAERLYRAVAYEDLRHQLVDICTATSKVVILDCCYSGRALVGHMGAPLDVANHAVVEGTYLMTASAETKLAWAPEGEAHTAFTGELLKAMERGIPGGRDPLEMESLFWHVHRELSAKSRPIPQQRARNAGHTIALVHNRSVAAAPLQAATGDSMSRKAASPSPAGDHEPGQNPPLPPSSSDTTGSGPDNAAGYVFTGNSVPRVMAAFWGLVMLVLGLVVLAFSVTNLAQNTVPAIFGALLVCCAALLVRRGLARRDRLQVGPSGIRAQSRAFRTEIAWDEIARIALVRVHSQGFVVVWLTDDAPLPHGVPRQAAFEGGLVCYTLPPAREMDRELFAREVRGALMQYSGGRFDSSI
jgi:hypothetical protein